MANTIEKDLPQNEQDFSNDFVNHSNLESSSASLPLQMYPFPSFATQSVHPKRRQVKVACTNCQKACKKCDQARPCLRCVKYGFGAEGCMDSQRKERQKGIKRGPYRKRVGKAACSESVELPQADIGPSKQLTSPQVSLDLASPVQDCHSQIQASTSTSYSSSQWYYPASVPNQDMDSTLFRHLQATHASQESGSFVSPLALHQYQMHISSDYSAEL
ncbi:unnamed protein product [Mycena citricolor]|uniref:Transcription activator of gluconeogenesis ERT1 n=1 Tax=Mycena citricolor TaxID=2018698 RepID=A0AAD2K579_9AGAR|nr:unnamed protein product [Mycena citricolor]